ncbi:hypothetical protein A5N86_05965 [Geobacillus thermoleovorans]|uniref:hypothetical protein n=1 Tax=Geobacillus thermoleovorans TaxID=33941 RepID=UPI000839FCC5|nr:hypothetical protein [Geobacillus thermoleovorans]ODA18272.1 hypothetical protein A5N86_05965 [Geobacillus thermoleovorans]
MATEQKDFSEKANEIIERFSTNGHNFSEVINKIIEGVEPIILKMYEVMRPVILIREYEHEIQKMEQLIEYTRHSKKRNKHIRHLERLQAELSGLYKEVEE